MKKLVIILLFIATSATAQIRFSADFESGSMEKAELVSQENKNGTESYTYNFYSRFDPANPARPTLAPSARWYYFRMDGVKDKEIILNVKNSDARRPYYSYDNENWTRFSETESPDEKTIIKNTPRILFILHTISLIPTADCLGKFRNGCSTIG